MLRARVSWVFDSLEPVAGGRQAIINPFSLEPGSRAVAPEVASEIELWSPDFRRRLRDYQEAGNEDAGPNFWNLLDWLTAGDSSLGKKPWFPLVDLFGSYDDRCHRIKWYCCDGNRLRIKPHPPFREWYSQALEYPLPGSPSSYHLWYSEREQARFLDQLEQSLCSSALEAYNLEILIPESVSSKKTRRARSKNWPSPSEAQTDRMVAVPPPLRDVVSDKPSSRKERVEAFLAMIFVQTGAQCNVAHFWRAARYTNSKTYYDWVSGRRKNRKADKKFEAVFKMAPAVFLQVAGWTKEKS